MTVPELETQEFAKRTDAESAICLLTRFDDCSQRIGHCSGEQGLDLIELRRDCTILLFEWQPRRPAELSGN